jgi:multiple sugar transport system substrate-binding protein
MARGLNKLYVGGVALLLLLPLAVLWQTGCSGAGVATDDKVVKLTIWQGFTTEETIVFKELAQKFAGEWEAENPGKQLEIQINYVSFGDMYTKLKTAAMARITPDIAFVDALKVTDLAFGRALLNLEKLNGFKKRYSSRDEARKQFVEASFNAGVVNRLGEENLYGLPVQTTTVSLFRNLDMFRSKAAELRAAGLDPNRAPQTWEELFAYGEVLTDTERGIYAYGFSGSLWFLFPFFNMYDVDFITYGEDGQGKGAITTPNGRAAMERMRKIVTSGVEGGAWKRSSLIPDIGFTNKKYAMILTGPWNVENFANSGLNFDISMIPAPSQEEIDRLGLEPVDPTLVDEIGISAYSSSNVGGQTGVIMRTCEHPEIAYEFLEYFTSEAVQREWSTTLGQIPTRLAAWEDLDMSKYPFLPKFMMQLRTAKRLPAIPMYGILEADVMNPEMDYYFQNENYDTDQALQNMERVLKAKILDRINEIPKTSK